MFKCAPPVLNRGKTVLETRKETFIYHMTLREGLCSNHQSTVIWVEEVWPNHHITFIVAKKLNLQFILLYLQFM